MDVKSLLLLCLFGFQTCKAVDNVIEVDIVILGGGMAGITAADYIHNNGLRNFLVLEAQDYVGGRIKNISFGGSPFSEGANWIHLVEEGDKNPILQLAKKLKVTGFLLNTFDTAIKNDPGGIVAFNKTLKALHDAAAEVMKDNEEMSSCKDKSLKSALLEKGWNPDTGLKRAVEWFRYDFEYAAKPEFISARHFTGVPEENLFITSPQGFATVMQYLARNVTDKIKTRKIVEEIKYSLDRVEVKTNDGYIYKANYTLCTFSTGVLASNMVKFVPDLPSWKMEAIMKLPMAYYTHIFLKFPTAFWDDNENLLDADNIHSKFYYVLNVNTKGFHRGSNILLFTAIGDDSLRVENQPENVTTDEVMTVLRQMYPKITVPRPTEVFVSKWSKNPYVRGSYTNAVVGTTSADFRNLNGRLDNLFFAGEAGDEEYWGYLQSAYFTGLKQAKAIVNCINGKECTLYKPEKSEKCSSGHTSHSVFTLYFLCVVFAFIYI